MPHYAIRRADTRELFSTYIYAPTDPKGVCVRWARPKDECYSPAIFSDGPNSPDAPLWLAELQAHCPDVVLVWVEVTIGG